MRPKSKKAAATKESTKRKPGSKGRGYETKGQRARKKAVGTQESRGATYRTPSLTRDMMVWIS
jgi:hypothetical protein